MREAASLGYRKILLQRLDAYLKSGLKSIPAYSRDGDTADPAEEPRNTTLQSKVLARYFPDLYNA